MEKLFTILLSEIPYNTSMPKCLNYAKVNLTILLSDPTVQRLLDLAETYSDWSIKHMVEYFNARTQGDPLTLVQAEIIFKRLHLFTPAQRRLTLSSIDEWETADDVKKQDMLTQVPHFIDYLKVYAHHRKEYQELVQKPLAKSVSKTRQLSAKSQQSIQSAQQIPQQIVPVQPEIQQPIPYQPTQEYIPAFHVNLQQQATFKQFDSFFFLLRQFSLTALVSFLIFFTGSLFFTRMFHAQSMLTCIGMFFSFTALVCGMFFFLYSLKYYLTIAIILSFSRREPGEQAKKPGIGGFLSRLFGISIEIAEEQTHPPGVHPTKLPGISLAYDLSDVQLERAPFVSIQVATYNEKRVIDRFLLAATAMEYANYEVIVADDSTDETVQLLAQWQQHPKVKISHRANREGYKGAALKEALKKTDPRAEFLLIFDADFIPYPDSITQFVKYFQAMLGNLHPETIRNTPIAAVQGYQWHILNKSENWITRGVRTEYAGSYVIERSGAEVYRGLKQISGSVYMIRRDVLQAIGWGTSITEDFELTLKLYQQGYKVIYTPYIQTPAEAVSTIKRLIRQRMRWAEGHSFNVKRVFLTLLFSSSLTLAEKLEFLYLAPYYLQAFFFMLGTLAWLTAEVVFHTRLPFWTETWGWSLVITNICALPLMNLIGLFMEQSEERDYVGLLSFVVLSYILAPFQAFAAVKGFLEKEEGPWFRTPKTGRITDSFIPGKLTRFVKGLVGISTLSSSVVTPAMLPMSISRLLPGTDTRALSSLQLPKYRRFIGRTGLALVLTITITLMGYAPYVPYFVKPAEASSSGFGLLRSEFGKDKGGQQDLTWGVLAINPNKSVYTPGEQAYFAIAVLDAQGKMVCDATLQLKIHKANITEALLSTENGKIHVTPECSVHDYVTKPDYEASYQIGKEEGEYTMILSATTGKGQKTMTDSFFVRQQTAFAVERLTQTRIYPVKTYPVLLRIRANEDFTGRVTDIVPQTFSISQDQSHHSYDNRTLSAQGTQQLIWNISLKAGQETVLGYLYKAPEKSPEYYTLGKLQIADTGGHTRFSEAREWQIASDNTCTSQATGNWSASGTWTGCGSTTPQSTDTVVLASGYTVTLDTDATIAGLTFNAGTSVLDYSSGTHDLQVDGDVTMNQPTAGSQTSLWSINGGSATVTGTITMTADSTNSTNISKVALSSGGMLNVANITVGTGNSCPSCHWFYSTQGTIHLSGALTGTDTNGKLGGGNFDYNGSSAQTLLVPWGVGQYTNLTINNTAGVTLSAAITTSNVIGNITVQTGTLKNGGHGIIGNTGTTLEVDNGASLEISGAQGGPNGFGTYTFQPTSTVRFLENTSGTITSNRTYGNLELKPAADSITLTLAGGTCTVAGNLVLGNGTNLNAVIDASVNATTLTVKGNLSISANTTYTANTANELTIYGNFTNNGTFTANNGTVIFADPTQTSTLSYSAATTFYNLTANIPNKALVFPHGSTPQTNVSGTLTLNGQSCDTTVALSSDSPGSQFYLNATATQSANFVTVHDSNAVVAITAGVSPDTNSSHNNTNWTFSTGPCFGMITAWPWQRKVFYDSVNGVYWRFANTSSQISIDYNTAPWTSGWTNSSASTVAVDTHDFSLWHDGTYVFLAYTDAGSYSIKVQKGTLSATAISWGTAYTALAGSSASDAYQWPSLTEDSSGLLWVTATHNKSVIGSAYETKTVVSSSAQDPSAWGTVYTMANTGGSSNIGVTLSLGSGNMLTVYSTASTLSSQKYTSGSGYAGAVTISTNSNSCTNNCGFAVSSDTSNNAQVVLKDKNGYMQYFEYTTGSDTWSGATQVSSSNSNNFWPTISVDTATNDIYVLYEQTSLSKIYYNKYTAASTSWGGETDTGWTLGLAPRDLTSNFGDSGRIYAAWQSGTTAPFSLNWNYIIIPEHLYYLIMLGLIIPVLLKKQRMIKLSKREKRESVRATDLKNKNHDPPQ